MILENENKIKELYEISPTKYLYLPLGDIEINGDNIISYDKDKKYLYSYYFEKSFKKIDFNIGYKKIYLNESMYLKLNKTISSLSFSYKITKLIKCSKKNNKIIKHDIYELDKLDIPDDKHYLFVCKGLYDEKYDYSIYDEYTIWYCLELISKDEIDSYESLKNKIEEIKITKNKPSLLLHSCCGPCSSYVLDFLHDYFSITIIYYNPNIYPYEEYVHRLQTQKEIINKLGFNDIKIIEFEYNHKEYLDYIKGYELLGEKSLRCFKCYEFRMELTAKIAKNNYDYFTTTISISPYKVSKWLNEIGFNLEKKYNTKYLYSDFKRENGYLNSINLSKKFGLYRQEYCGCEFSIKEKNKDQF